MAAQFSIVSFDFVSRSVRIVMRGDEPWFVAADVCAVLEYRMASDMTRFLDDDEKGTHIMRTPGGDQEATIINESGLYAAILKSRKPEAKKFKKWVTSEVLPALRRTGRYEMPQPLPTVPLLTPSQRAHLDHTADLMAMAFHMKNSTRLWLLKYCRAYAGVNRLDHIPAARFEDVLDFLNSLRRPIDHYLRERVNHERNWLTQTLQRELDHRLGRSGTELELFQNDLNAVYAGVEGGAT
ncbi:MAG: Bro-N domain-containing protein [Candidatus Competibacteraceae bacterium]|nr:Bro-N domain-containing protein [Candidatus Competibacteraceae bacterium]